MAQLMPDPVSRFDPHTSAIDELLRISDPLRDADVAARSGGDASGLNAAIIVLRRVYWVLLKQLRETSEVDPGDDLELRDNIARVANRRSGALNALQKNEERFSLLAAAWLEMPLPTPPSRQAAASGNATPRYSTHSFARGRVRSVTSPFYSSWAGRGPTWTSGTSGASLSPVLSRSSSAPTAYGRSQTQTCLTKTAHSRARLRGSQTGTRASQSTSRRIFSLDTGEDGRFV